MHAATNDDKKKERGGEEEEAKAKSPTRDREARQNFEPALHIWHGGGEAHAVVIDLRRKKEKEKSFCAFPIQFFVFEF